MRPHACDDPRAPSPPSTSTTCNGSTELCAVPYDHVVFAATHNAHAIAGVAGGIPFLGTVPGGDNQEHSIHHQLDDGVRGLMIDVGRGHRGTLDMCHGGCGTLDYGPFAGGLRTIRAFLDAHPRETITLMLELTDGITSADVSNALRTSDLAEYVFVKPVSAPWPTLGELGKKLIVFSQDGAADLVMSYWDHAFENPYHYPSVASFEAPSACDVDRGVPSGVFVFNHFLTPLGAIPRGFGFVANGASLQSHLDRCIAARGRTPNFVTVDWYTEGSFGSAGSLVGLVSSLNARLLGHHASRKTPTRTASAVPPR